ncbi:MULTISPECIES: transcription termination/antitermination protein NusG [unclassified Moritella]|uniref:transcription termination/antitermination protein NusG n=1 Tax=unclassified Moritella TaxID=2637987 RepID=UPI001BAA71FF|nr:MULTISPECIES: UpxY family transcription antiterminator [unclassified Moritella]QUM84169.1 UpxY family transcription antiterminator [Moritella sp. 28]QUM88470.1 UpxY family transcription antiterminator [Moritella sp. 36]
MEHGSKKWYAVYTHSNAEKKLHERILSHKLESYLPLKLVTRQWTDRVKKITLPVFKSYLFVFVDLDGLQVVKKQPGFSHFIRFGAYPTEIQQSEIDLMKNIITMQQNTDIVATQLVKGDRVKIIKGVLTGYKGILTEHHGAKKIAIEVKQLQQSMLITVPLENIIKVYSTAEFVNHE